jgi:chaperone modulatory protein CbpM
MSLQLVHAVWLNEGDVCTLEYLAEVSGLSLEEINDLVDSGSIAPAHPKQPGSFALLHVSTVRRARRLRDDFQLDRNGLALAMTLLRRIDALEESLLMLQPHLRGNGREEDTPC